MTNDLQIQSGPNYDTICAAALATMSTGSARIYGVTYAKWVKYCDRYGLAPLPLDPTWVMNFLQSQRVSKGTRSNQLAALRKLAWIMSLDYQQPAYAAIYEYLRKMRAPVTEEPTKEHDKSVLRAGQVENVLSYWNGSDHKSLRNRLIVSMALATGARREEIVNLKWSDIDLHDGTVNIAKAKGDKTFVTAIVDNFVFAPLKRWRECVPDYSYIFVTILKNGKIGNDEPISGDAFYKIVHETGILVDVELSPHKFRRTLATELDHAGTSVADIQAQLNHASPVTTIKHYIKPGAARSRRDRLKTGWNVGDEQILDTD